MIEIDDTSKFILEKVGIFLSDTVEILLPREVFLNDELYDEISEKLTSLKQRLSSTYLTSLHKHASSRQKWPLLNLVRQILTFYKCKMLPVRKCDGYTLDGVKKFKRYFLISKTT
jgi:hypothetical protein